MTLSILVTGASGYVGSYLVPRLAALPGCRVAALDGDVTAPDLEVPPADVVVHLAGKLNSFSGGSDEIERVNFGGTANLARRCGPRTHFVFLSSDQVFPSHPARTYEDDDLTAPDTPYGRSKARAEALLLSSFERVTILRTAILHGYRHPRRRNTVEFIDAKLRAGEPIELYRDVYACPTYIEDLAACVQRAVLAGVYGVFHACGPEYLSRCDIAEILCAARGHDRALIRAVPRPPSSNIPCYLHLRASAAFEDLLSHRLVDGILAASATETAADAAPAAL